MNYYNIANISCAACGDVGAYFQKRMAAYSCVPKASPAFRVSCEKVGGIALPPGKAFHALHHWGWLEAEDGGLAAFHHDPDHLGEIVSLMEADKQWSSVRIRLREVDARFQASIDMRFFAAMGIAFHCAALSSGFAVLHSSSIEYNGNALLFSAPSGTGKSTHSALWRQLYPEQTRIINDDTTAIRLQNGVFHAWGIPWSGKTELNRNASAPVKAIVFLEQGPSSHIRELKGPHAVARLLSEVRKAPFPHMIDLVLQRIDDILETVPIYLLTCDVSHEAVHLVKNALSL